MILGYSSLRSALGMSEYVATFSRAGRPTNCDLDVLTQRCKDAHRPRDRGQVDPIFRGLARITQGLGLDLDNSPTRLQDDVIPTKAAKPPGLTILTPRRWKYSATCGGSWRRRLSRVTT